MCASVIAGCVVVFLAGATGAAGPVEPTATMGTPVLKVEGNRLKTLQGATVRLQGVNIASLEWTSTGEHVIESLSVAIDE
jgi:hypothetical protein